MKIPKGRWLDKSVAPAWLPTLAAGGTVGRPSIRCRCEKISEERILEQIERWMLEHATAHGPAYVKAMRDAIRRGPKPL